MRTALHSLLRESAEVRPHAPALTSKDDTRTYAALWDEVARAAHGLRALGLRPGDRCAVYLDKRPETVASLFAISAAAGVFVPVNPVLKAAQVAHIIEDCAVSVLVTSRERLAALGDVLDRCKSLTHVVLVGDSTGAPEPDGIQVHPWAALVSAPATAADTALADRVVDVDVAAILYTSGSTGSPKGVVLSHRNLIGGAESVSSYLANTADDVILAALPLSFDAGLSQVTTAFAVGAHVVLLNYLLPGEVPRLCARHGVTGLTCVPPLWIQIADLEWPEEARTRLRYFANTGGKMPRATLERLRSVFPGAQPYLMYGLTESFRSTYLPPAEVDRRPDSIGRAIPNAEVLVVRPDGTPCEPGEEGELVHRGALVALGYWGDPGRTAERFRPLPRDEAEWRLPERCVWSGDRVVAAEEGFLYFIGRTDEMIKTSGYRVSPTEIEEAAYSTGQVRDAVAIGVPDARLGHRVVLVATPSSEELDPAALLAALRRQLPLFMVPETVDVRAEIPRSPNGKFDRARLRDELCGEAAS